MAMDKELEIVCKTALDGQHVINVPAPLDGLTLAAAQQLPTRSSPRTCLRPRPAI